MKTHLHDTKLQELISAIERNREHNFNKSLEAFAGLYSSSNSAEPDEDLKESGTVQLVIFASESPFLESICSMLKPLIRVKILEDSEMAVNFILEFGIKNILLDLDTPSNSRKATDVFSAVKTLNPSVQFFAAIKNPLCTSAQELSSKGVVLLKKPLLRKQIEQFVKKLQKE